jgi:predicted peptidase
MCRTLLLTFVFIANTSFGQTRNVVDRNVDSTEAAVTRAKLNGLSTIAFEKRNFQSAKATIPYRILLPKELNTHQQYPLVITFHNSSRIGTDNETQLEPLARTWLREESYDQFRCFVLAPQFGKRSSNYTPNKDSILVSTPSEEVAEILTLIDDIEREYPNIDKDRIYLVGYSMGASTAQNLMALDPKKFAAMVSIAGVPDLSNIPAFKRKNIWLIHGAMDDENPYIGSESLYGRLKGNKRLIFTSFTQLSHNNIMIPFLLNYDIPKWLFDKKRK